MIAASQTPRTARPQRLGWLLLAAAIVLTTIVYWPGLSGNFLFDDYPNIVDNHGVQPQDASISSLVRAALSSPSSSFKRPLASLSFAANYLATGLDPYWMKLTNLLIHLLNGLLVFLLARGLLWSIGGHASADAALARKKRSADAGATSVAMLSAPHEDQGIATEVAPTQLAPTRTTSQHCGIVAALIAAGWMLLPINLTGVLYVVQRMESMANAFVLLGLIGYVAGRRHMLRSAHDSPIAAGKKPAWRGFALCVVSVTIPTVMGLLAKETAVMLPLYALLIEWVIFRWRKPGKTEESAQAAGTDKPAKDWRIASLFLVVLVLPMVLGLAWLLPGLFHPATWATRDFSMATRLLSEARIVVDYIVWTLLPTPSALSFYHDDFLISSGLLAPWTTLASIVFLAGLIALMFWLRKRRPLAALGIALFLGCQLLTGTIIPLELIYEHRNYFASFGLLLVIVPLLAAPPHRESNSPAPTGGSNRPSFALPRYVALGGLLLYWTALTAFTSYMWGNPLRLAEDLAARAPQSPRAQYELGRIYIIYSNYDPASPFTPLVYAPLEKAAALPHASILPEQALIFMNARMHRPLKDAWWDSMIAKLKAHKPGVQDESSLGALTQCAREHKCALPPQRMMAAFMAALAHPNPSSRFLATYGDYAWNVLNDHALGLRMTEEAVKAKPDEPAYQITEIRMLAVLGRYDEARKALQQLATLNIGGRLDSRLHELRALLPSP